MAELYFYRLEGRPLIDVLPQLVEKSRERGWRVVVEAGLADSLPDISRALWTFRPDAFLPHGFEGDGADEPVWLTATAGDNPNRAEARLFVSGAVPGDISALSRAMYLFAADDAAAVEAARERWKSAKAEGHGVRYFIHAEGRWKEQG